MDSELETSAGVGACFGSRIFSPAAFSMTCGSVIPIGSEGFAELRDASASLEGTAAKPTDHRKFATALYRHEIEARAVAEASDWAA